MGGLTTCIIGGFHVAFSDHAIERFQERVRPCLANDGPVWQEIKDSVARGDAQLVDVRPGWVASAESKAERGRIEDPPVRWLMYGPDVCFPLVRAGTNPAAAYSLVAPTCLTRGSLSPEARTWRRTQRQGRRKARRAMKLQERNARDERKDQPFGRFNAA